MIVLSPNPARRRRRAFTLVEMIVVIGVIVLLAALTVAIIPAVTAQSQQRETENILRLVDLAVEDWLQARERRVTIGNGTGFDIDTNDYPDLEDQTERLLTLVMRRPESAEILRQIPGSFLVYDKEDDGWDLSDAWDEPIVMIRPGRPWQQGDGGFPDADGTIRTDIANIGVAGENQLGVVVSRKIAFVSAGADGELGDLHLAVAEDSLSDDQKADLALSGDNLVSYPVLKERP